jgi:mono/diheme cytochrome c family protein
MTSAHTKTMNIKPEKAPSSAPWRKTLPVLFLSASLVACGGGGSSSDPTPTANPPPPPPPPPTTVSPKNGQSLWTQALGSNGGACANCHGATPSQNISKIWNASGTAADQGSPGAIGTGISNNSGGMSQFRSVSTTDLADIASYINAVRYNKPI